MAVTVTNRGTSGIQQLEVTLRAPLGWAVEDTSTAVSGSVKPGQSVTAEFLVQVPEGQQPSPCDVAFFRRFQFWLASPFWGR